MPFVNGHNSLSLLFLNFVPEEFTSTIFVPPLYINDREEQRNSVLILYSLKNYLFYHWYFHVFFIERHVFNFQYIFTCRSIILHTGEAEEVREIEAVEVEFRDVNPRL